MSEIIEQRELYSEMVDGVHITVQAIMEHDYDADLADFDCYTPEDVEAWRADRWQFVAFMVAVEVNHTPIGFGSLCGIEHGTMGEDPDREGVPVEADAWDLTVAEYGTLPNGRPYVAMGSPLNGAVMEAIDSAREWLSKIAPTSLLDGVTKWADPNKKEGKQ